MSRLDTLLSCAGRFSHFPQSSRGLGTSALLLSCAATRGRDTTQHHISLFTWCFLGRAHHTPTTPLTLPLYALQLFLVAFMLPPRVPSSFEVYRLSLHDYLPAVLPISCLTHDWPCHFYPLSAFHRPPRCASAHAHSRTPTSPRLGTTFYSRKGALG